MFLKGGAALVLQIILAGEFKPQCKKTSLHVHPTLAEMLSLIQAI